MARLSSARLIEMLALGVVILMAVFAHLLSVSVSDVAMDMDACQHVALTAAFRAVLLAPGDALDKIPILWSWPALYPQGVYGTTSLWMLGRPASYLVGMEAMVVYIAVLAISCWALGRRVGGPLLGLTCALLAVGDPIVLNAQHRYWLDMPLAAAVLFSIWCLVRCERFKDLRASLLLGFSLGAGMLVKFTFFWFLGVPVLWAGGRAVLEERPSPRRIAVFVALLLAAVVCFKGLMAMSVAQNNFLLKTPSLSSPFVVRMFAGSVVIVALWLLGVHQFLTGRLAHISYALCLAAAMVGPWVVVNDWYITMRWNPVAQEMGQHVARIPESLRIFATYVPLPLLWMSVAGAAAAVIVPSRREVGLPVLMAYLCGLLATLAVLPMTNRYTTAPGVLLAFMAVFWVPRRLLVQALVLALAAFYASVNLFGWVAAQTPDFPLQTLQVVSGWTRRLVADDYPAGDTDPRAPAAAAVALLPPATRTLYIVSGDRASFEGALVWLMVQAELDWRLRVVSSRQVVLEGGRPSEQVIDHALPARIRTLAAWHGLDASAFPLQFDPTLAPDSALVLDGLTNPGGALHQAFGVPYTHLADVCGASLWVRADAAPAAALKDASP